MGTRAILVDGYNVIRKTTGLAEAERVGGSAAGREALLALIASAFVGQRCASASSSTATAKSKRAGRCPTSRKGA